MPKEEISETIQYEPGNEFLEFMNSNPEKSHTYLHKEWAKILNGLDSSFTLEEIYRLHKVIVGIMRTSDIRHIANIDTLDTTETLSKIKDMKIKKNRSIEILNQESILAHIMKTSIKNPIAFLLKNSDSSKIDILLNFAKEDMNTQVCELIKDKVCRLLPIECKNLISFVDKSNATSFDQTIPIADMDEELQSKIFDIMAKWDLDSVKKKEELNNELPDDQKSKKIYEMTSSMNPKYSRADIAKAVNLSKSTVYLRQKDMGLQ